MTTKTSTEQPTRFHYYLVVGSVVVQNEDNIQAVPQNAMLMTDTKAIGEHQLGKAQQALQVTLFRKMGEPVKVVDVILHNLVHLGEFTAEEFHAKPEGMDVRETPRPSADIIDFTSLMNKDA